MTWERSSTFIRTESKAFQVFDVSDARSTSYLCEPTKADQEKETRPPRIEFPQAITSRAKTRQDIVANDYDRLQVLSPFASVIDCLGECSDAYCLVGQ